MKQRHLIFGVLAIAALAGALAYLRDPPWLIHQDSGFRGWESGPDGMRYRWTGGHASFFVPADANAVTIPMRTTFASPADPPLTVTITIDDRSADRVTITDPAWRTIVLHMPPGARRRVRRIDLRLDRTREGNKGVQVGEMRW